ncbi:MAG TPA: XRE family transcriptional regulator [Alphaproteobacteria bacterium]|jgi:transcriptional regulator with XRE-family HTH domain|nr:XRE family transcriptional regulator [Alphaproteobacteria bacterium]
MDRRLKPDDTGLADSPPPAPPESLAELPIGEQIRDLRKARDLTIAELARRIGRSVGYVSQIERNLSAVSISVLQQIAGALGVQVSWFFQGNAVAPEDERDFIVRRGNRRRLQFDGGAVVEELLSPNLRGRLELVLTTFRPGGQTGDTDRVRKGEEAGLVLSGTLEILVESRRFTLEAGDSFAFRNAGRHRCRNPGRIDATVLWVHTPPSY